MYYICKLNLFQINLLDQANNQAAPLWEKMLQHKEDKCPEAFYQCSNNECIPDFKVCDFYQDCRDGIDEKFCNGKNGVLSNHPLEQLAAILNMSPWLNHSHFVLAFTTSSNTGFRSIAYKNRLELGFRVRITATEFLKHLYWLDHGKK